MVKKWAVKNTNTNDLVTQGLKTKREAEETLDFYSSLYYALYTELDKDYKNIYEIVSNSE
jgi:hypothetical protein|tara:strand:+ start:1348 stop:1527 length:180 start_codon:yes stop_codon:yes gene_type:complete